MGPSDLLVDRPSYELYGPPEALQMEIAANNRIVGTEALEEALKKEGGTLKLNCSMYVERGMLWLNHLHAGLPEAVPVPPGALRGAPAVVQPTVREIVLASAQVADTVAEWRFMAPRLSTVQRVRYNITKTHTRFIWGGAGYPVMGAPLPRRAGSGMVRETSDGGGAASGRTTEESRQAAEEDAGMHGWTDRVPEGLRDAFLAAETIAEMADERRAQLLVDDFSPGEMEGWGWKETPYSKAEQGEYPIENASAQTWSQAVWT